MKCILYLSTLNRDVEKKKPKLANVAIIMCSNIVSAVVYSLDNGIGH